jgi:hypothetical protein
MTYFMVLTRHLSGGTEENHDKFFLLQDAKPGPAEYKSRPPNAVPDG